MNPDLDRLQPYPFEQLARLKEGTSPPQALTPINCAVGEPQHQPPGFVTETLISHLHGLAHYPVSRGSASLRTAITHWLVQRFHLPAASLDPAHHVLPVSGTREALFAFAQAVVDRRRDPVVVMPNPFYQIYEGAALLAGAEPHYIVIDSTSGIPDLDSVPPEVWQRTQLIYICTPGNPTGAVMELSQLQDLIQIADEHDFLIAADECYSELYLDDSRPPPGLLQAAAAMDRTDYARCVVFHSLSKRSNLPGLRSGFVAGDAQVLRQFLRYRTYHGCTMPPPSQAASTEAWGDEGHVRDNRYRYREKFDAVLEILAPVLPVKRPAASFYLWPETPIPDTDFARLLYDQHHVTVLPGRYLGREVHGHNPGAGRVRIALVPPLEDCIEAAQRLRRLVEAL